MFSNFLPPVLYVLKLILPVWIAYRLLWLAYQYRKKIIINLPQEILIFLFVAYLGGVVAVTIVPASVSEFNDPKAMRLNIIPVIKTIKNYIASLSEATGFKTRASIENIAGNLMLFFPMGIFLPVLYKKIDSLKKVIIICVCSSISIEVIQYVSHSFGTFRTADVDDVILNTVSGMLGWLMYANFIRHHFLPASKGLTKLNDV